MVYNDQHQLRRRIVQLSRSATDYSNARDHWEKWKVGRKERRECLFGFCPVWTRYLRDKYPYRKYSTSLIRFSKGSANKVHKFMAAGEFLERADDEDSLFWCIDVRCGRFLQLTRWSCMSTKSNVSARYCWDSNETKIRFKSDGLVGNLSWGFATFGYIRKWNSGPQSIHQGSSSKTFE